MTLSPIPPRHVLSELLASRGLKLFALFMFDQLHTKPNPQTLAARLTVCLAFRPVRFFHSRAAQCLTNFRSQKVREHFNKFFKKNYSILSIKKISDIDISNLFIETILCNRHRSYIGYLKLKLMDGGIVPKVTNQCEDQH